MIQFTYDEAYKLRYDLNESAKINDPALQQDVRYILRRDIDNYVIMCQTLPMKTNPTLIIEDKWAVKLTEFYKMRKN
ncbi:hypothetical protein phiAS5_ORF0089 [Aeromonas phage phiAS5]|uniref:Uncharacterized protein n=1 Tax=Aeromonas phage phiAS5 TaxID=879630 RepID=E1A2I6_9CAUD|nr:hypothetical protein phiAS5_ORF0089 [Aeromonas phage phiAS5]ADM79932.1 hypothetical protein phiAS5_ORF0089 [Aeromonas phage phiAS5]BES53297.1 hypothetical protein [Aeromonas phage phiWae14]